jgi:hypothetical protein
MTLKLNLDISKAFFLPLAVNLAWIAARRATGSWVAFRFFLPEELDETGLPEGSVEKKPLGLLVGAGMVVRRVGEQKRGGDWEG